MKLDAYLEREDVSPSQFAARLGKPASTITRIVNGERRPGLPLMEAIMVETGGEVTPMDFTDIAVEHEEEGATNDD